MYPSQKERPYIHTCGGMSWERVQSTLDAFFFLCNLVGEPLLTKYTTVSTSPEENAEEGLGTQACAWGAT